MLQNSKENKYIQSATLEGVNLDKPWIYHSEIIDGGKLILQMGSQPNKEWGSDPKDAPPSMTEEIPEIVFSELFSISDDEISVNEQFTVNCTLKNTEGIGSKIIKLFVNGKMVKSIGIVLDSGESKTVKIPYSFNETGSYKVKVEDFSPKIVTVNP